MEPFIRTMLFSLFVVERRGIASIWKNDRSPLLLHEPDNARILTMLLSRKWPPLSRSIPYFPSLCNAESSNKTTCNHDLVVQTGYTVLPPQKTFHYRPALPPCAAILSLSFSSPKTLRLVSKTASNPSLPLFAFSANRSIVASSTFSRIFFHPPHSAVIFASCVNRVRCCGLIDEGIKCNCDNMALLPVLALLLGPPVIRSWFVAFMASADKVALLSGSYVTVSITLMTLR